MGANNSLGPHPLVKSQRLNQFSCMETSEGAVHGTGVYSAGVGPKGPALERFPVIKKKKRKLTFVNIFYL
jgi:hypothetical protein